MKKLLCSVIFFGSFALLANLSSSSGVAGYVVEVGGLKSYVSGSPHSKHAVILASDIYGYTVINLRNIADKVAAAGFYAVVPDFFHGDPYDPQKPLEVWLKLHQPVNEIKNAKRVIKALRRQGVRAVGFAGFCWGGKLAVELAKTNHIQAVVLLHPAFITVDDIKVVKVPIAILAAELDVNLPPSLLKQIEEILSSKPKIHSNVKIYHGVLHGWTVRYDPKNNTAVKAADEAHQDMIKWFIKFVK